MKKLLIAIAMICSVMSVSAQRAGDATSWNDKSVVEGDFNHSGFFLNPTIGVTAGDVDTGFGVGLGLGYRWHIGSGFNWDIVKADAITDVSNFTDALTVRFQTGVRYNSPVLFSDKGLYADFGIGYQFNTNDTDMSGVAYEIGIGLNMTRTISLGLVWEGNSSSYEYYVPGRYGGTYDVDSHWGMFGVRLGLNF